MRGEATVRFEMGTVFVCRTDFDSLVAMHKPFQKKSVVCAGWGQCVKISCNPTT